MQHRPPLTFMRRLARRFLVLTGASVLTVTFFLVLPLIQAITKPADDTLDLVDVDTGNLPPPPPPPPEDEPEDEEEEEEEPPELEPDIQPLDLAQLELALNPGLGDGMFGGDFSLSLDGMKKGNKNVDALFSLADLDQAPRGIYQPSPVHTPATRSAAPGTIYIIFLVDESGKVVSPKVQKTDSPAFERPALEAIKKWKFEPGKRNGEPVKFRTRQMFTFPKSK